jgi:hypothetical protein
MASEALPSKWVKLVSQEGHEFVIDRECAMISGTIKAMLSGGFMESRQSEIQFPEIKSVVLEKVIQYMYYKVRPARSYPS